jgi:hypothetical protein
MKKHALVSRLKSLAALAAVNAAVFTLLFVTLEMALHFAFPEQNPLLCPPFVRSKVRVVEPHYSHTLAANFDGEDWWGGKRYRVRTNSLGFKDSKIRDVPLRVDRKRVLFIGDSFTEGIGLPYEETFVGRFAAAFPQIDVLNAAVSSYAPSVYYTKIKHRLDLGFGPIKVLARSARCDSRLPKGSGNGSGSILADERAIFENGTASADRYARKSARR